MAKTKHQRAQDLSQRIAELVRNRALKAIAGHDAKLSAVYDRIADGIRKDLRAVGFTTRQVRAILEKHLAGTRDERTKIVERAIIDAAREARVLPKETFDAIFGKEAQAEANAPFARPSRRAAQHSARLLRASAAKPPSTD